MLFYLFQNICKSVFNSLKHTNCGQSRFHFQTGQHVITTVTIRLPHQKHVYGLITDVLFSFCPNVVKVPRRYFIAMVLIKCVN